MSAFLSTGVRIKSGFQTVKQGWAVNVSSDPVFAVKKAGNEESMFAFWSPGSRMNTGSKTVKTGWVTNISLSFDLMVLNANKNTGRESSHIFRPAETGFLNNIFVKDSCYNYAPLISRSALQPSGTTLHSQYCHLYRGGKRYHSVQMKRPYR